MQRHFSIITILLFFTTTLIGQGEWKQKQQMPSEA